MRAYIILFYCVQNITRYSVKMPFTNENYLRAFYDCKNHSCFGLTRMPGMIRIKYRKIEGMRIRIGRDYIKQQKGG